MIHLPALIQDLAIILMTAAVTTLVCNFLRQPVVLGYLVAGLLVGPHFPFMPTVIDRANLQIWADIGVVFLLFSLGLEFSFKKLARVGTGASITALFEILFMLGVGFGVGQALGWTQMDSLFLGGILSISSTTIIARVVHELRLQTQPFVSLVMGVLIVEDLVAVLLMVLLSTLAARESLSGEELARTFLQFGFFLTLWFLMGIYFLPLFFRRVQRYLTEETKLITAIGLCLMMVLFATEVGFSAALGAFVMGSLLAETREGKTIEKLLVPVRDLFAAVFFVSVGMLMDLDLIAQNIQIVLLLTVVTILGKFVSTLLGALIAGRGLRQAVQAGMSLAQIGEFSFIIATLGLSLNVISPSLYPIAVAVSGLTTFTTPYLIRGADRTSAFVEEHLPISWKMHLQSYQQAVSAARSNPILHQLLKEHFLSVLLNTVIVVAALFAHKRFLHPLLVEALGSRDEVPILSVVGVVLLCIPFLWALTLGSQSRFRKVLGPVDSWARMLEAFLLFFRVSWGVFLIGFIVAEFTSLQVGSVFIWLGLTLILFAAGPYSEPFYRRLKGRFLENLEDRTQGRRESQGYLGLAPWDANLAELIMSADSELVGKTLKDSALREGYGVTIALIERGQRKMIAPHKEVVLMPQDRLYVLGSPEQLQRVRAVIEKQNPSTVEEENYGLQNFIISENSKFRGKSLRDLKVRESLRGLVVGVERAGQRILNPEPHLSLRAGDTIWVVGDRKLMEKWPQEVSRA